MNYDRFGESGNRMDFRWDDTADCSVMNEGVFREQTNGGVPRRSP
jgi:hypothetical protein